MKVGARWTRRLAATLLLAPALVRPAGAGGVGHTSCLAEIGREAALELQDACRGVSPATHPPCGATNGCAIIKDEIARSCALIGEKDAAKTPACARAPLDPASVLRRYYEALNEHDYGTAYAMLRPDGGRAQDFTAFRDGYAHTKETHVLPGVPSAPEGAAGSSYVTVPVAVEATLDDGSKQRFTGSYVLRAVNAQGPLTDTRWFIFSSELHAATP